jgi:hypothetical protein
MTHTRMDEAAINASLDACLHGAREGDSNQAKRLHELLDLMLMERETEDGKLWLTDHGKMLLADMHRQLSRVEGSGHRLHETVLDAVQLKPRQGHWRDTCEYLHDLRVAIAVANELCEQQAGGGDPNVDKATRIVAERGEFDLEVEQIRQVYEEIASTLGGFREIAHC